MQNSNSLESIRKEWYFINLPDYRDFPVGELKTYHTFAFAELPPIQEKLNGTYNWLENEQEYPHSIGNIDYIASGYSVLEGEPLILDFLQNDVQYLLIHLENIKRKLPKEFVYFLLHKELQRKIRSSTHCNLGLSVRPALVEGKIDSILLTFLVDSQGSPNWSLFVGANPEESFVVCSSRRFGYDSHDVKNWASKLENEIVDLSKENISICANSFEEFIYRFWIENKIWFSMRDNKQLIDTVTKTYAEHYRDRT